MKRWLLVLGLLGGALSAPARAERYWVSWEGNDYPENEGWQRIVNGPQPAERTLHDDVMTMDGLADRQIDDYYRMERPIDPGPGEMFVMEWRMRVDDVVGNPLAEYDPGVGIYSDDDRELLFVLGKGYIRSFHEDITIAFAPGLFHTFTVRSADMLTYTLDVDGSVSYQGSFWEPTFESSYIAWGDISRGSSSLAAWDYCRFGTVPEPSNALAFFIGSICFSRQRRFLCFA